MYTEKKTIFIDGSSGTAGRAFTTGWHSARTSRC